MPTLYIGDEVRAHNLEFMVVKTCGGVSMKSVSKFVLNDFGA